MKIKFALVFVVCISLAACAPAAPAIPAVEISNETSAAPTETPTIELKPTETPTIAPAPPVVIVASHPCQLFSNDEVYEAFAADPADGDRDYRGFAIEGSAPSFGSSSNCQYFFPDEEGYEGGHFEIRFLEGELAKQFFDRSVTNGQCNSLFFGPPDQEPGSGRDLTEIPLSDLYHDYIYARVDCDGGTVEERPDLGSNVLTHFALSASGSGQGLSRLSVLGDDLVIELRYLAADDKDTRDTLVQLLEKFLLQ